VASRYFRVIWRMARSRRSRPPVSFRADRRVAVMIAAFAKKAALGTMYPAARPG
jgi:hypothetical protein